MHNVIKKGEIQTSTAVTLKEPLNLLLLKTHWGYLRLQGFFNQKEEIRADVDPSKLPSLDPLPFHNGINCCYFTLMQSTTCSHVCHSCTRWRPLGCLLLLLKTIFGFKQCVQCLLIKMHACYILGELQPFQFLLHPVQLKLSRLLTVIQSN